LVPISHSALKLPSQCGKQLAISEPLMPARLTVNINAIAYLRNRRDLPWRDLVNLGPIALQAGAHGPTAHKSQGQKWDCRPV
jgi:pyridoxine 5-phosphate synthase